MNNSTQQLTTNGIQRSSRRPRNLEIYSVAILGQNLNLLDEFQIKKLKRLIDYITLFDTQDDVKNYIKQNEHDRIILIVSVELGETIIRCTHDLEQLYQIYVYNPTNSCAKWTNDFQKIQDVVTNSDVLLEKLEIKINARNNDGESFLKFHRLTAVAWYLQFIQLLFNINNENNDRQSVLDYLTEYYAQNPKILEQIRKFEHEYSPSAAIYWYTKDSFVYRTLNKAFRTFDIEFLILFRFFIADLYQQLQKAHEESNFTSSETIYYRGQLMHKHEIESLEEDQCVCTSSFFSTTRNRTLALEFFAGASDSRASTEEEQPVLFLIRQSSFRYNRLIYADIAKFSDYSVGEEEVLFAIGSYFRVEHIWLDNNFWYVELAECYVKNTLKDHTRPVYVDIITVGFYLCVKNDDFQLVTKYFQVLLKESNSLLWIVSCHVGLGLIDYYKKNYHSALEKFNKVIEIIKEENLLTTCEILRNIYCILANVYREIDNYEIALDLYNKAIKIDEKYYFIEEEHHFWSTYFYDSKINPFIINDRYFYYCDRLFLNMAVFFKVNQQWELARQTFQRALKYYSEWKVTGKFEMFIKILQHTKENSNPNDLINENRKFLDGKTLSKFLDEETKRYVLHAYDSLGHYYLKHISLEHALICFQEILQGELEVEIDDKFSCFYGIGSVYQLKQDYIPAVNWLEKAIDLQIDNMPNNRNETWLFSEESYEKFLLIYIEKLNDKSLPIIYMEKIIHNLLKNINRAEIFDVIATIYKITVYSYHNNDKTRIEFVLNYIYEVLDRIQINYQGWKKWVCIGSTCDLKKFKVDHYICEPILDDNYNIYFKFYDKIVGILSANTSHLFKTEIKQCEKFLRHLKILKLDHEILSLNREQNIMNKTDSV